MRKREKESLSCFWGFQNTFCFTGYVFLHVRIIDGLTSTFFPLSSIGSRSHAASHRGNASGMAACVSRLVLTLHVVETVTVSGIHTN